MGNDKQQVHDFWNQASCGEVLFLPSQDLSGYQEEMATRYSLEPYILEFAQFEQTRGMKVLELGVGLGADHQRFAESGAQLWGLDLTPRAIEHTQRRLAAFGLSSNLEAGDAESLTFPEGMFDRVYSWGVIHHSPETPKAVAEIHRVLKPGGRADVMIYHKWSMIGLMLWLRYALLGLRPWLSLSEVYSRYLESPGTKAYSVSEARELFSCFGQVEISTVLSHGDLLESEAGQRHKGMVLDLARALWPRRFIQKFMPNSGLFMLIRATK